MYGLTLVTAPAEEPLATSVLRDWVRISGTSQDTTIDALALAARRMAEKLIGRAFVTQTWDLTLDGFPWPGGWQMMENPVLFPDPHTIRIPKAPLQSVTWVKYYDLAGTLQTLDASTYDVDTATDPGRVALAMNKVWPVTKLRPGAVSIRFVAGYGAASAVPEEIKLAIKFAVAKWIENRGEGPEPNDLPEGAKALLRSQWNGELEYGTP